MMKRMIRLVLAAALAAGLSMSACAEQADGAASEAQSGLSGAQESGTGLLLPVHIPGIE